mmetsp:Transcript_16999/g.22790  ORF Transcript_16999/g.22790 Transcript_16999/m.22790 type:complete len:113 (-) Transcript_16999:391-729(-)
MEVNQQTPNECFYTALDKDKIILKLFSMGLSLQDIFCALDVTPTQKINATVGKNWKLIEKQKFCVMAVNDLSQTLCKCLCTPLLRYLLAKNTCKRSNIAVSSDDVRCHLHAV